MRRRTWAGALGLLVLSVLACGFPLRESESTPSANVELAVEQTIAAQQLAITATNLNQGALTTITTQSQVWQATQTAISLQTTGISAASVSTAQALEATATSQSLAATIAAFNAQATAKSYSQTATAQAYSPPQPPPPIPPPPANMIRISFSKGATSATVGGQINRGQTIDYVLRALAGQTMMVSVFSPNNNVYLGILGLSDNVPLMRTSVAGTSFNGVLSRTQDYQISLFSPDQQTNFTLQVIVPARIQFAPGAISAAIPGYLNGGEVNYYLLKASAGQTMTATIYSPKSDIFLTIYGVEDGSPLVRAVMAQTSWTGNLPGTQDYMIQAVSTGGNANYTLEVIVQ